MSSEYRSLPCDIFVSIPYIIDHGILCRRVVRFHFCSHSSKPKHFLIFQEVHLLLLHGLRFASTKQQRQAVIYRVIRTRVYVSAQQLRADTRTRSRYKLVHTHV